MSRRVSVVVATYNRGALLKDLLADLAAQTYPADDFEVIVIDDGSKEPVVPLLEGYSAPYKLTVKAQKNAGAAAARHHGVELAEGEIVVITDDDMKLVPEFLAEHVKAHDAGATVVLGQIAPAPGLERMPVFERFHAYQLDRFVEGVRRGRIKVRGVHVCTGNLSFRRADYLAVGGFDRSLGRSEDRELGIRLEKAGGKLVFSEAAKCIHESDHADLKVWLKRAFNYGVYDRRIAQKHPELEIADPWRFFFLVSHLSKPLMLVSMGLPDAGDKLAHLAMAAALESDKRGLRKAAVFGTTLCYGLEYFRGMRDDAGSAKQVVRDLGKYLKKRRETAQGRV
jgi:GT2 family glycosyltransferase